MNPVPSRAGGGRPGRVRDTAGPGAPAVHESGGREP